MSQGGGKDRDRSKLEEDLVDDWETADYDSIPIKIPIKEPSRSIPRNFEEEEFNVCSEMIEDRELWQQANSVNPSNLLVSSTGTGNVPPADAFSPSFKILKRTPTPQAPVRSVSSQDVKPQKTLQERQADYESARERIFGKSTPDGEAEVRGKKSDTVKSDTLILREPKGPDGADDKGFRKK